MQYKSCQKNSKRYSVIKHPVFVLLVFGQLMKIVRQVRKGVYTTSTYQIILLYLILDI